MSREGKGERGNELSRVGNHEIRGVQKDKERNKEQRVCGEGGDEKAEGRGEEEMGRRW